MWNKLCNYVHTLQRRIEKLRFSFIEHVKFMGTRTFVDFLFLTLLEILLYFFFLFNTLKKKIEKLRVSIIEDIAYYVEAFFEWREEMLFDYSNIRDISDAIAFFLQQIFAPLCLFILAFIFFGLIQFTVIKIVYMIFGYEYGGHFLFF